MVELILKKTIDLRDIGSIHISCKKKKISQKKIVDFTNGCLFQSKYQSSRFCNVPIMKIGGMY